MKGQQRVSRYFLEKAYWPLFHHGQCITLPADPFLHERRKIFVDHVLVVAGT